MNVNLTPHFEDFVQTLLANGRYSNASEVIREGLRLLEERQQLHEAKLRDLRTALDEGDNSPDVPYDIESILVKSRERRAARKNQTRGRHA